MNGGLSTTTPLTPKDEALLILEYLETEELCKTFLCFLQESRHLKELRTKLCQVYHLQKQQLDTVSQSLSIDDEYQTFFNKSLTLYNDMPIQVDNPCEQQKYKSLSKFTCDTGCQTERYKVILDDNGQPNFAQPININSLACTFSPPPSPFINCQKNENIKKQPKYRKRKEIIDLTTTETNENSKKQKQSPVKQLIDTGNEYSNFSPATNIRSPPSYTIIEEIGNRNHLSYKLPLPATTPISPPPPISIDSSTLNYHRSQSESLISNFEHYSNRQRADSTEITCLHTPQPVHYEEHNHPLIMTSNIVYDPLCMSMVGDSWNATTNTVITELKKDPLTGKYTLPECIIETPINHSNKLTSDILSLSTLEYQNNNNECVQTAANIQTFSQSISSNVQQDVDYSTDLSEASIIDLLNSSTTDNASLKIQHDGHTTTTTSTMSLDDLIAMPHSFQSPETIQLLPPIQTIYSNARLQPIQEQHQEQQFIQLQFIQAPISTSAPTKVIFVSQDLLQSMTSSQQIQSVSTSSILNTITSRQRKSRSGKENKTNKKIQNITPRTS